MLKKMQFLPALCGALSIWSFAQVGHAAEQLRIYNWTEYLPKPVIEAFQKETGIEVQYDVFDTAETLEAKLMTGSSGYDIAFPSHSQVPRLVQAGAILPLDKSKISNWKNLDVAFLKNLAEADPGNAYAVPYLWGTTLIGYNVDKVTAAFKGEPIPNSWALVFNPKYAEKLKDCGIAFLDAPLEIFEIALNYMGLDPHATDQKSLEKARDLLLTARPNIKYFHSARWMQDLANGDICVAVGYSGGVGMARDLAVASGSKAKIEAMFPNEGALAWSDDMVIPKGAQNTAAAYKFIDYIQRPDVIAQITNTIGYPNANTSSTGLIDKNRLADESLFIPESKRNLLFFPNVPPLKSERVVTRFWNSIRSGN
ncbi:polyamine ABC transporter substrate-binding protein [Pseudomonas alliivorans]|nr:polyamine ABC transporter substrate-binding protein [Pseudomonas alliivorans]